MKKATAIANANIALVKYWGKRDQKLVLPQNSSISLTLDGLTTVTTVEFSQKYERNRLLLDNQEIKEGKELERVIKHLNLIRRITGIKEKSKVVSQNNFPTAAGLASSASGFAALSLAAIEAAGQKLNSKELSIIARQGSGSASRSCYGGFVEWQKGERKDGSDSYALQIAKPEHWPELRIIASIVLTEKKKISSRVGMEQTVRTSSFYGAWLESVDKDLEKVKKGILEKDFSLIGRTAEENCLKMHATMVTTKPPIIYWQASTLAIIQSVLAWREQGLECYFTIDAGPQVKIICLEDQVREIKKRLKMINGLREVVVCKPGQGPKLTNDHLF
jgi:diphosphomevalonate decarboxylase